MVSEEKGRRSTSANEIRGGAALSLSAHTPSPTTALALLPSRLAPPESTPPHLLHGRRTDVVMFVFGWALVICGGGYCWNGGGGGDLSGGGEEF